MMTKTYRSITRVYAEYSRPKNPILMRTSSAIRTLRFSPTDVTPARTARITNAAIRTREVLKKGYSSARA